MPSVPSFRPGGTTPDHANDANHVVLLIAAREVLGRVVDDAVCAERPHQLEVSGANLSRFRTALLGSGGDRQTPNSSRSAAATAPPGRSLRTPWKTTSTRSSQNATRAVIATTSGSGCS
jgi:hypothetical protein